MKTFALLLAILSLSCATARPQPAKVIPPGEVITLNDPLSVFAPMYFQPGVVTVLVYGEEIECEVWMYPQDEPRPVPMRRMGRLVEWARPVRECRVVLFKPPVMCGNGSGHGDGVRRIRCGRELLR